MAVRCFEDEKWEGAWLLSPKHPCKASSSSWSQQRLLQQLMECCSAYLGDSNKSRGLWRVKSLWVSCGLKGDEPHVADSALGRTMVLMSFKVPSVPVFPDFVIQGQLCWARSQLSCWAEVPCDDIFSCVTSLPAGAGHRGAEVTWSAVILSAPQLASEAAWADAIWAFKKPAQMCMTKTNLIQTWK